MQFSYNINFKRIVYDNMPLFLRKPSRLAFIRAATKPFCIIYKNFIEQKNDLFYRLQNDGSVISLENVLNDKFDPILRRITIADDFLTPKYTYFSDEGKPPFYTYSRWKPQSYATNCIVIHPTTNEVYQANTTCVSGDVPGVSANWTLTTKTVSYIYPYYKLTGLAFKVSVPTGLVFNEAKMRAWIDYFRLAGVTYRILIV